MQQGSLVRTKQGSLVRTNLPTKLLSLPTLLGAYQARQLGAYQAAYQVRTKLPICVPSCLPSCFRLRFSFNYMKLWQGLLGRTRMDHLPVHGAVRHHQEHLLEAHGPVHLLVSSTASSSRGDGGGKETRRSGGKVSNRANLRVSSSSSSSSTVRQDLTRSMRPSCQRRADCARRMCM